MKNLSRFRIGSISLLVFFFLSSCTKQAGTPDNSTGLSSLRDTSLLNQPYGSHLRQVYDIHLPANRDTSTPILLMIHGGAWKAGQKEDLNGYVNIFRQKWKNLAIVNINYRYASFANKIHHTEMMGDIQKAVDTVLAQLNKFKISSKMMITGASAGGQLAMIYAYKYNTKIKCVGNIFGPSVMNDWSWYNSTNPLIGGFTGDFLAEYVGKAWDTAAYKAVSPFWNVTVNSQPTIIFHGNLDPIVPVYQSQWFHGKLRNLGVPVEYHEYIAFHSFDNSQSDDVINKMIAFFKLHLK